MAHDEATNKLTLANLMALLRAGTVEKEAEAVEIAKNILETKQPPEYTGAGVASEYDTKLLPLTLKEALNNKKYIALYDKPELNPLARKYNASDYLEELQKLQADIYEAAELLNMHFELTERRKQKAEQKETDKGDLVKSLQTIGKYFVDNVPGFDWELLPYIVAEMDKPGTAAKINLNAPFDTTRPEWLELIEAAKEEKTKQGFKLPAIDGDKVNYIHMATDAVNHDFWEAANPENNNQITINSQMTKNAGALVTTAINFDDLPEDVKKKLSHFEKRVFIAAVSLINAGCRCVTPEHIFFAMGFDKRPGGKQLEAVTKAFFKMRKISVIIDNYELAKATNYKIFPRGTFYLLPVEIVEAVNTATGKTVKTAFLLPNEEPKLMQFARLNNQVTTFPRGVYLAQINKTEKNLQLEDYILSQISWMKNPKSKRTNNKICLQTVCDVLNITHHEEIKRTADKIKILLDHYTTETAGYYITNYEYIEEEKAFNIIL